MAVGARMKASLEARMQSCLDRLGIPLKVVWTKKAGSAKHGEISSDILFIYDEDEREAWLTFEHEVYEYKFKEVTYAYRTLVNGLIETVEKLAYERKEKFLEFIPKITMIVSKEKGEQNGKKI